MFAGHGTLVCSQKKFNYIDIEANKMRVIVDLSVTKVFICHYQVQGHYLIIINNECLVTNKPLYNHNGGHFIGKAFNSLKGSNGYCFG